VTEVPLHIVREPLDFIILGDVALARDASPTEGFDLAANCVEALGVDVGDGDVEPFARERESTRTTDAARAAGDDCGLVVEDGHDRSY
jgi:hypothetical protein